MFPIYIVLAEQYVQDTFQCFSYTFGIGDSPDSEFCFGTWRDTRVELRDIVEGLLGYCIDGEFSDIKYVIVLSEGDFPKNESDKSLPYTKRPDIKVKQELTNLLSDSDLIKEAQEYVEYRRLNPIGVSVSDD
tara:strand:+ start:5590 stop:5985 length:396 start_codon:yes stop_codon:yes gene_type:complete